MMTPGPEALSWRGEISLTKILYKRRAREKERKTNEHIKGRKEEHSGTDDIATQRRRVYNDVKKKKRFRNSPVLHQTHKLISDDLILPPG